MEPKLLSRAHLETLSSADLIALADDYGIDIPDDLNRRFIIGELLDVAEELSQESGGEMAELDTLPEEARGSVPGSLLGEDGGELPRSFNETQVDAVLRNPAWAFVFWDVKSADAARLSEGGGSLMLRVSLFESEESQSAASSFELNVSGPDMMQFVMLPPWEGRFVRFDLVAEFPGGPEDGLAFSRRILIPAGSPLVSSSRPGREPGLSPVQSLSGMRGVLRAHYESHRETFSAGAPE